MINIKKCKFTKAQIDDVKRFGIGIELEHTNSRKKAEKIAFQHSCEFGPNVLYYQDGLIKMEKQLKKMRGHKK